MNAAFLALKRIKYYRRSTMTEPRLNDLAVLSIESDLSRTLDLYMLLSKSLLLWIKIIELHCPNVCEYCLLHCDVHYQNSWIFYSVLHIYKGIMCIWPEKALEFTSEYLKFS